MPVTEHIDLRGGRVCWLENDRDLFAAEPPPQKVDVAIIGAGVTGAMLADRLTAAGRSVAMFDRRPPALGSTAASTALVMWAADTPLTALAKTRGAPEAARCWRRVHAAVQDLAERIAGLDQPCAWAARPEVYLAGSVLEGDDLLHEADARRAAGLPSAALSADAVAERFAIPARAGLVSGDAFAVDPVALTYALLARAQRQGATVTYPADVVDLAETADGVFLTLADGRRCSARQAILATGYEAPRAYLPKAFTLGSSFAIATAPGVGPLWREEALIWEASEPYLYGRATADGRIVIGGGDEDLVDPRRRDALIASKADFLCASSLNLLGRGDIEADCAWAATFGRSPDGLPAIGPIRGSSALWLASGFGGNGVTFASLAASMITAAITGAPDADMDCFSPYRFG